MLKIRYINNTFIFEKLYKHKKENLWTAWVNKMKKKWVIQKFLWKNIVYLVWLTLYFEIEKNLGKVTKKSINNKINKKVNLIPIQY